MVGISKEIFNLHGKTAIVTGGTGILGKSFCSALAAFGANVVVLDLSEEKVSNLAKELSDNYENECLGLSCDITSIDDISRSLEEIKDKFESIDILHNNAQGETIPVSFEECSLEEWRVTSSVNEEGYFLMAQAVGKEMIAQGKGGSIIQTSSIYGVLGPDHRIYDGATLDGKQMGTRAVYSFSKAGVIGLSKYLATYWAKKNIRVNCLSPGGVFNSQDKLFVKKVKKKIPLGRLANKYEYKEIVQFLCSDASSYMTGSNVVIDGGRTII